jgi:glucan phosphoethanolaminetransferase (alkaline phosphatase superfamily)
MVRDQAPDSTAGLPTSTPGTNWISTIPFLFVWLPAVIGIFRLKFASLPTNDVVGFNFWTLPLMEKLSIFRTDILLCFLLIPLGLFLLTIVLPRQLRGPFWALFSIFWLLVSYANVMNISAVGRLLSFSLLRDSLQWAWGDPRTIRDYVHLGGVIRFLALMALAAAIAWWASKESAACLKEASTRQRWVTATRAATLPLAALVVLPWLSGLPSSPSTRSVMISSIRAFWGWEEQERTEFQHRGPAELLAQYRELAHIDVSTKDPRYWSRAEDSDVIVFVIETGPAKLLPIDGNLDDFPNLRMLRDRAFVAPQHYTTYPYTERALFSIFSAWYPTAFMNDFVRTFSDMEIPGIVRELSSRGYKTAIYSPFTGQVNYDVSTARALGFERLSFNSALGHETYNQSWTVKRSYDLNSLHLLESDIEGWINRGQRYLAAFTPQLSHSPWFDVTPDGRSKNLLERGRHLMALEDAYLGEILKLLAAHHRLDKTLIVVVGDHGLRTGAEDPGLKMGMLDDISFHVPMLVYAPQVLTTSVTIPWLTSHIDIAPTLLDLMGVDRRRDLEQGSPIWDASLQGRTTFLFARHFFSADGYYANSQFVMWNEFFDTVYADRQLHFGAADAVPSTSAIYHQATDSIERMVNLQQRWGEVFGRGAPPGSR